MSAIFSSSSSLHLLLSPCLVSPPHCSRLLSHWHRFSSPCLLLFADPLLEVNQLLPLLEIQPCGRLSGSREVRKDILLLPCRGELVLCLYVLDALAALHKNRADNVFSVRSAYPRVLLLPQEPDSKEPYQLAESRCWDISLRLALQALV